MVNMLASIAGWIIHVISALGYPGIVLTMAIESALIPLPSEIIMPFSGFLASQGRFALPLVILAGAVGNTVGSLIAYSLGFWGKERVVRRFIRKYGKFILVSEDEFDSMEKFMHKYKAPAVIISRVVPGFRTIVALPAGVFEIPMFQFLTFTFIGSLVWSALLASIGFYLGKNWKILEGYFRKFEVVIVAIIALAVVSYIYTKLKKRKISKVS